MSHSPAQGASRLPGRGSPRAAAAAWVLTVLALGATASTAMAAETSDQVLVRVNPGAPAAERAGVARALDAGAATGLAGGWRVYTLNQPLSLARARALLAGEPAADAVHLDLRLHPMDVPDDPLYGSQWALPKIGAPAGWDAATTGTPVTVAVIDTGIDTTHPDLSAAVDEPRRDPGQQRQRRRRRPEETTSTAGTSRTRTRSCTAPPTTRRTARTSRARSRRSATTRWAWPAWPTTRASWR